ncbi:phosphatase PAP2 family protein [Streptomyces sp. CC77]|uniref:phosphatase PAP2 family protein n=1 Tax=Streptomyces sp. CC77 TaxID=1906739 RepID=UPI0008DE34CB|nr:hypothetical protein BJP39_12095 [Streptomyces sp. CC77]
MSQDLYRAITDFAHGTPAWVHTFTEIGTDAGLFVFLVLCVVAWWRARPAGTRAMALAALAPVATAFGYVVSETLKTFVQEERPCRAVVGAAASIAECPAYGDWSFPSNHSAIAGAFAMALVLAWRRTTWFVVPLAVLMAFSRVFVGVHYPHDVAAGLIVGALAVVLFVRLLTGPTGKLVETMRTSGSGVANWLAGPGEGASGAAAVASGASTGRRQRGTHRQHRAVRAPGGEHREQPQQERPEYPAYPTADGQQEYPQYQEAQTQQQPPQYQGAGYGQHYAGDPGRQPYQGPEVQQQYQGLEAQQLYPPYTGDRTQQHPDHPGNQGGRQHPQY